MSDQLNADQFDEFQVLKPGLYLGMLLNVLLPALMFFLIYYCAQHNLVTPVVTGESANLLFYIFLGVALTDLVIAYVIRERMFKQPCLTGSEFALVTLTHRFRTICIVTGACIESIAILGSAYFFLTTRFQEAAILILISAGAYQLVRPRPGGAHRFIEVQVEAFNRGDRPLQPPASGPLSPAR